jgi:beta-glucosidase
MACVKHYAMYGAAESRQRLQHNRHEPLRMFNEYLPPYKAAVDAGAGSVMASFNEVDGIPATGNRF